MFVSTRFCALWVAGLSLVGLPAVSDACLVGFDGITHNRASDEIVGEQQLYMRVSSPDEEQAAFTFYNVGFEACAITQIHFERGPLAKIAAIHDSSGVSFHEGGSPSKLPGGNSIAPKFETAFRVSADSPSAHNGVNNGVPLPGEWVEVVFDLAKDMTFQDVLRLISSGEFRVGLHVQDFRGGGSEAFVSKASTPVPEPTVVSLAALGLLGVLRQRRRC